jgi:hypothetical protein
VVVGGIYSPNHQTICWGGCLSMGAPDSAVCHRTLSGAPATSPNVRVLTVSTVGALTTWGIGQSGAAPDNYCSVSGAPLTPSLTSAHTVHTLFTLLQTTIALLAVAPLGAPDSPVNYSGAAPEKPEGEEFSLYGPWCTRHYPVAHRTVRCV